MIVNIPQKETENQSFFSKITSFIRKIPETPLPSLNNTPSRESPESVNDMIKVDEDDEEIKEIVIREEI